MKGSGSMEDKSIVELFRARSEEAISEASSKYSSYCRTVAYNILRNSSDTEECLNDTMQKAWSSIPPENPRSLKAYLGKITRNLALNRVEQSNAAKRGSGQYPLVLAELEECIASDSDTEKSLDNSILSESINTFLASLPKQKRIIFVRRYWHMESVKDIAKRLKISESKVKTELCRTRQKLKDYLEKEDIYI